MDERDALSSLETSLLHGGQFDARTPTPEDGAENEQQKVAEERIGDSDDDEPGGPLVLSSDVDLRIRGIREKMEYFGHHVTEVIEEGRNVFYEAAGEFEKQVDLIHQTQIEQWEREIEILKSFDEVNKSLIHRLTDSQATISHLISNVMNPSLEK